MGFLRLCWCSNGFCERGAPTTALRVALYLIRVILQFARKGLLFTRKALRLTSEALRQTSEALRQTSEALRQTRIRMSMIFNVLGFKDPVL